MSSGRVRLERSDRNSFKGLGAREPEAQGVSAQSVVNKKPERAASKLEVHRFCILRLGLVREGAWMTGGLDNDVTCSGRPDLLFLALQGATRGLSEGLADTQAVI